MKKPIRTIIGISLIMLAGQAVRAVDATWEYAVRASATIQASPANIKLTWPQDTQSLPSSYAVYRKSREATSCGWRAGQPDRTRSERALRATVTIVDTAL